MGQELKGPMGLSKRGTPTKVKGAERRETDSHQRAHMGNTTLALKTWVPNFVSYYNQQGLKLKT